MVELKSGRRELEELQLKRFHVFIIVLSITDMGS